uniref:Uncharacterized protein n=1 Tax=Rhizophora mucronata TaxID=61149 RepID=A0A2P2Q6W8_RHIMU
MLMNSHSILLTSSEQELEVFAFFRRRLSIHVLSLLFLLATGRSKGK